ncbi:type III-B CRISPR module RAMP protein Cmr6 [Thermodesulfovibrionales bacterium]|nr:type III-B CRISPR module RAMP protein Cmr6 [Thermodesulfovibrionales bacterium]
MSVKIPYKLPFRKDILLADNRQQLIKQFSNLGLLYNKYPLIWTEKDNSNKAFQTEFKHLNDKRKKEKINLKHQFLTEIISGFDKIESEKCLKELNMRQQAIMQGLQNCNWQVESMEMVTDTRLILGLGGTSVTETGITLHPLYGFPYLPASGLKGLARAYAEIADNAPRDELLAIFGSESKDPAHTANNRQGKVFFMDGLPTKFPKLDLDIMNPHFGEYYQGDKPPADYLNPVPVTFLAVAPGQKFSFGIHSRDEELLHKAKAWLVGGLTDLGAGGKTNVGYGYFKECEPKASPNQQSENIEIEEDNSLMARLNKLKPSCNPEQFVKFVKSIKMEERDALKDISFKGMDSVNIGLVPYLDGLEVSSDVLRAIAEKMLEVIQPKKKWDNAKHEKYHKLLSMAGKQEVSNVDRLR